jgi:hypothetical protein
MSRAILILLVSLSAVAAHGAYSDFDATDRAADGAFQIVADLADGPVFATFTGAHGSVDAAPTDLLGDQDTSGGSDNGFGDFAVMPPNPGGDAVGPDAGGIHLLDPDFAAGPIVDKGGEEFPVVVPVPGATVLGMLGLCLLAVTRRWT